MIPASSNLRNSSLAVLSLSGSRRRCLANTGRPVVWMMCCTPCLGWGEPLPELVRPGNSLSSFSTWGGRGLVPTCCTDGWQVEEGGPCGGLTCDVARGGPCGGSTSRMESRVDAKSTLWVGGEMSRSNFLKKSIPRIGLATSANKNRWENLVLPNLTCSVLKPQALIEAPLADLSFGPKGRVCEL